MADEEATPTAPEETSTKLHVNVGAEAFSVLKSAASETSADAPKETGTLQGGGEVGGAMQGSSNAEETIVVHTDSAIEYGCPANGTWSPTVLAGSLTGSVADGPGCFARLTFTGDSVTVYGATGPKAGVFGCSSSSDIWEAVGWWNAYGTSPLFASYQGSCTIAGLGFGKHTITITNSPDNPKLMYFTGLRYTTNQSAQTWAAPEMSACCSTFTFPDGATTTINPKSAGATSSGTSGSGSSVDLDWKKTLIVSLVALGLVGLSSVLVGAMCCRRRKKPVDPLEALVKHVHESKSLIISRIR